MIRFLLILAFITPVLAVMPDERLQDAALEARARVISQELRCMVCQNQSIDDSDATIAKDLRLLVRERLVKGESDKQVIDYIHARYGDFILLRPPFNASTYFLWLAPFLLLILAIFFLYKNRPKDENEE